MCSRASVNLFESVADTHCIADGMGQASGQTAHGWILKIKMQDQMFKEESQWLKVVFGDELIDIHHIGSTSVPGLKAKPTLSIIMDEDKFVKELEKKHCTGIRITNRNRKR
jgi:hypothetical protein